jgi:hypothetical protein
MSVVGVLAVNELQHAISESRSSRYIIRSYLVYVSDELGDEPEAVCNLMPNAVEHHAETSTYSYSDIAYENPYDLSLFIDQVGLYLTERLCLISLIFEHLIGPFHRLSHLATRAR